MRIADLIKQHEGLSLTIYKCPAGKLTIGYGINLEAGITEQEAEYLLENRIKKIKEQLKNLDFWTNLSIVRRAVLVDMAYNLGISGLLRFRKMFAAIRDEDWQESAEQMKDSIWYGQVGNRSERLCKMMLTDEWPES